MEALAIDRKKFGGKYIATESFASNVVVASGKDANKVYEEATNLGYKEPVINYVYKEGVVCMY